MASISVIACFISCFAKAVELLELRVSVRKTEVLHLWPSPKVEFLPPHVTGGDSETKPISIILPYSSLVYPMRY